MFVRISEFGVRPGTTEQVADQLRSWVETIDRGAAGRASGGTDDGREHAESRQMTLYVFGQSDIAVVHVLPEIRYLAAAVSTATVTHQRSFGATTPRDQKARDALLRLLRESNDASDGSPIWRAPLHAIIQVKVDPLANLVAGDAIAVTLAEKLCALTKEKLGHMAADVESYLRTHPDPGFVAPDWQANLEIVPLVGLDTAEFVLLARASMLEAIVWLSWALRRLRVRDVLEPAEIDARAAEIEFLAHGGQSQPARDSLADAPLLGYTFSTVGIPRALVRAKANGSGSEEADLRVCDRGVFLTFLRTLPGVGHDTDSEIRSRVATYLRSRTDVGPAPAEEAATATVYSCLGLDDVLLPGLTAVQSTDGVRLVSAEQSWQLHQLMELIARTGTQDLAAGGLGQVTQIGVAAFPRGFPRPDTRSTPPEDVAHDWQSHFDEGLIRIREHLLDGRGSYYDRLRTAAKAGGWPYSFTNGALNLLVSLATLVTSRHEFESFLDLAEPLLDWIDLAEADPHEERGPIVRRPFRHLDRLIHAHAHRESPVRAPAVSRALECRAGYEQARNALHCFLREAFDARCAVSADRNPSAVPPVLVDGTDTLLREKDALGSGMVFVSAVRVHQPLTWPAIIHEVEHIRMRHHVGAFAGPWHGPLESLWNRCHEAFAVAAIPTMTVVGPRNRAPSLELVLTYLGSSLADEHRKARGRSRRRLFWLHTAINQCIESVCDIAVLDSGVLASGSPDELLARFAATMLPNLALDARDEITWTLLPGERRRALAALAPGLALRLAVVEAVALAAPAEEPAARLSRALSGEGPANRMLEALFDQLLRPDRTSGYVDHSVSQQLARDAWADLQELVVEEPDAIRHCVELARALRVRSPEPHPDSAIAAVGALIKAVAGTLGDRLCPPMWPRGWLDLQDGATGPLPGAVPDICRDSSSALRRRRVAMLREIYGRAMGPARSWRRQPSSFAIDRDWPPGPTTLIPPLRRGPRRRRGIR